MTIKLQNNTKADNVMSACVQPMFGPVGIWQTKEAHWKVSSRMLGIESGFRQIKVAIARPAGYTQAASDAEALQWCDALDSPTSAHVAAALKQLAPC